jgi:5-methylcytosine-specific restriction endonuclease McrA
VLIANESLFLRRTSQAYRNEKKRAAKCHLELKYTLEELRSKARGAVACPYCGMILTEKDLSFDHMMPVARRADAYTWTLANTIPCCQRCNQCKSVLDHDEFKGLLAVVLRMSPQAQTSVLSRLRAGAARIYGRGK